MKIDTFAGGLEATFAARTLPLARALRDCGAECKVIQPIDWHSISARKLANVLSVALTHSPNAYTHVLKDHPDAVLIGRVSTPQIYLLQKLLKNSGVKTIFDLDDPLFLRTGSLFGLKIRPGSFCLERILRNADSAIVNGHYLLGFVRSFNKSVTIIHDPVDIELFSPKSRCNHDKVTICWEGVPRNHYENLSMLVKPLCRLAKMYDIKFKLVSYLGDSKIKQMFSKVARLLEMDYGLSHWVPLTNYAGLLSDCDISVAPLLKTPWYEGKSSLRVAIGMAMGIPVVASPVGEQKYVIRHKVNGFLAKTEEDWYDYLKLLVEDTHLRDSIGRSGRETAEKELSSSICGKKLFDIIDRLLE
jgi:glycosyltransferase involved in cell wall biosynthesis